MADKTIIAWTHHSFNVAWGCMRVSAGCERCYAEEFSGRISKTRIWGPPKTTTRRIFGDKHWAEPRTWNARAEKLGVSQLVFSSSMCDVFEDHPTIIEQLPRLFSTIRATPFLHWQLLTKRPERILESLPDDWGPYGYPNVWLGTSIEDMRVAERADHLRKIPATVRFFSYEPALGPLDDLDLTGIHWVIYGGESGPHYRKHDLAWPRSMRARCEGQGVAFFYKQSASRFTEQGITLDGELVRNFPTPRLGYLAPLDRFDWQEPTSGNTKQTKEDRRQLTVL